MSTSAGIEASGVTVTYRNGHTALHDASFDIPRGTITALVGVNGAGKSTLFKAIMGFVPAAAGEIRLLGKTVREALRDNLVAYVPQAEEGDWAFPVLEEDVVMMGRYGHMGFLRRATAKDHEAVEDALARVGMSDFRERQIGELSGGQRKRVFLARALAQEGQVILFIDELHTMVGAGKADGAMDAGNMLKPALARGELHCVGATTLDEYRQYLEKDAALERRFQPVFVGQDQIQHNQVNGLDLQSLEHRRGRSDPGRAIAVFVEKALEKSGDLGVVVHDQNVILHLPGPSPTPQPTT